MLSEDASGWNHTLLAVPELKELQMYIYSVLCCYNVFVSERQSVVPNEGDYHSPVLVVGVACENDFLI